MNDKAIELEVNGQKVWWNYEEWKKKLDWKREKEIELAKHFGYDWIYNLIEK